MGNSMKKITILLVIIFTFLFSTTSWGEWTFVVGNVGGDKYYYDKDRIRKNRKSLYFWELTDYLKPSKDGDMSHTVYVQLDCSIFRYKWLKFQVYKQSMGEGNPWDDWNPKGEQGEWKYPKPNSVIEGLYKNICEEHQ